MTQQLDEMEWPPIEFEGELLPPSLKAISILVNHDFSESTGDWIWRLPHCKDTWKDGQAEWCISAASEIICYLHDYREDVLRDIDERLNSDGFCAQRTLDEWIMALSRIKELAASSGGLCRWIAQSATNPA